MLMSFVCGFATYLPKSHVSLQLDVHLMLVSLDKNNTPDLQTPYLCCQPSLSVKQLCEVRDPEI